jgi:hypothetical protein
MLIYKMTHLPTGKIYIGSLKDSKRWETYNTSSKTVRKMLEENPSDWIREIVENEFPDEWTYKEVVDLENYLIKEQVMLIGWESVWNKHYGANAYSPEALAAAKAAQETPEWKEKRSVSSKKWFLENPEKAEERRIKITKRMIESTPKLREIQLEFIRNNPELHKARLEASNEAKRTPEARLANSNAKKNWFKNNPIAKQELYKKITTTKNTIESIERMSKGQKKRFEDKDELEKLSQRAKKRFSDSKERTKASERTKKYFSDKDVLREHTEKQRQRFSKTIEVTFDDGTKIQALGRKALENMLGCAGILRIIKGLRKFGTCKNEPYLGKVIVSARYVD